MIPGDRTGRTSMRVLLVGLVVFAGCASPESVVFTTTGNTESGGAGGASTTTESTSTMTGGTSSTTGGGGESSTSSTTTPTCEPYGCGNYICGTFDDGCGSQVVCGPDCPSPQICGQWCRCEYEPQPMEYFCKGGLVAAYCGSTMLPAGCTKSDKVWKGKVVSCCPVGQTT